MTIRMYTGFDDNRSEVLNPSCRTLNHVSSRQSDQPRRPPSFADYHIIVESDSVIPEFGSVDNEIQRIELQPDPDSIRGVSPIKMGNTEIAFGSLVLIQLLVHSLQQIGTTTVLVLRLLKFARCLHRCS